MEGKEAIINKILSDANDKAKENLQNANALFENKQKEAEDWAKQYSDAQNSILDNEVKEIVKRRLIVADLDVRKNTLDAKQKLIDDVFVKVKKVLLKMPKKEYISFVEKLIEKYAEVGDEVVLSNDKVLTIDDISNLSVFKKKKLEIADKPENFLGGVKLVGKVCDKDLSFDAIIQAKREELGAFVASQLFEG